jgi:hypothetical protein
MHVHPNTERRSTEANRDNLLASESHLDYYTISQFGVWIGNNKLASSTLAFTMDEAFCRPVCSF